MKTAFEQSSGSEDVSSEVQAKLTQCVQQLRKGFTDLMKRREEYKLAKWNERKSRKMLGSNARKPTRHESSVQGADCSGSYGIQTIDAIHQTQPTDCIGLNQ